jgi:hypothetical protein
VTEEREYSVHLRTPHEKQAEFLNSHAKRIVIRAGRHEGMAGQVGEEGRIVSLEGFVRQFLGTAVGDTKTIVSGSVLVHLRRLYGITMNRPAFVSRYVYPPPLDIAV